MPTSEGKRRYGLKPRKISAMLLMVAAGVLVSLVISLVAIAFLSLCLLFSDNLAIERHISYVIVGITLLSIFAGSVYATFTLEARGLVMGMVIGFCYVSLSILIGLELVGEPFSLLVLANKYVAGIAAGALGGLVGVNLS